jgi:hypothetical protein
VLDVVLKKVKGKRLKVKGSWKQQYSLLSLLVDWLIELNELI